MYEYKFSDDESDEIENKSNSLDNLLKSFGEIDSKYSLKSTDSIVDDGASLELERQTFERPTQEGVESQAKDSLADYQNSSLQSIENDYQKSLNAVDENLSSLEQKTNSSKQSLQTEYQSAKEYAANDAIKRGLARSSIIVNKLAQYDESMLTQFGEIEKNYLQTSQKLTQEKSLLEVQRQNALDAFDLSYAVKLTEKISSINEKLDKTENEVIEYNNKMEQLEKEYEADRQKQLDDKKESLENSNLKLLEYFAKYGTAQVEKIKEEEKYNLAYSYLMNLPKEQALIELQNNPSFKSNLKTTYSKIYSLMQAR